MNTNKYAYINTNAVAAAALAAEGAAAPAAATTTPAAAAATTDTKCKTEAGEAVHTPQLFSFFCKCRSLIYIYIYA